MPRIITLEGRNNRWALASLGGRLVSWEARDGAIWRKICRGDAAKKPSEDAHRASVMFPWVNRIGGDHWMLEGQRVPVNKRAERGHLHGLVFDAEFEIGEASASAAEFYIRLEPCEFYPRAAECSVRYEIAQAPGGVEAISVVIRSKNVSGTGAAYITTGIHPYFLNPFGGPADEMELQCAAEKEFAVDADLIPTGLGPVTPEHDFRAPRKIGATLFDSGFVLTPGAAPSASLRIKNFTLRIDAGENCGYAQVYIPPHREEIAIEPQSGGADAFRIPEYGLRVLKPGESFRTAMRLSASFAP